MPSTINQGLTSPLKRKISALPMESSDLRPTQKCGRRSSSLLVSAGPSSSPPAPPPAPEASLEDPREPSPIDDTTEVAYVDIYKYGTGCIINITDIIVDALDFALNDLLPLAIGGSFNKGVELWAKIGLQPRDQEDRDVTEIRRRDQPWEAGTMIARFTYDPTTLDLSRDECFDVHFSDKGQGSHFKMRRSTGTWQGRFPSDIILAENFGVTHFVKVWDRYLPIDKLTKPSRLPPGRSMRCRKYKCGGDNVKLVQRGYISPLDPNYISSFLPDRPDGDGEAEDHHYGGSDGDGHGDDDDSDNGGGEDHDNGRDGHGRDDNDAVRDEKRRMRIAKLTAVCKNNGEDRKALFEKRNNKGKAMEKGSANGKGH